MSDLKVLKVYSVKVDNDSVDQTSVLIGEEKVELVNGKLLVIVADKKELTVFLNKYGLDEKNAIRLGEAVYVRPVEFTRNGHIKNTDFLKKIGCATCAPKHSMIIIKPYDAFILRVSDLVHEKEYEEQLNYLRSLIISTFHCEELVLKDMFDESIHGNLKILEFYMLDGGEGALEINKNIFSYRVFNDKLILKYLVRLLKECFKSW